MSEKNESKMQSDRPDDDDPLDHGGDEPDPKYESHLVVPLEFFERFETIVQQINKIRRRTGKKKRALGWFAAKHLTPWMNRAEAELALEEETEA